MSYGRASPHELVSCPALRHREKCGAGGRSRTDTSCGTGFGRRSRLPVPFSGCRENLGLHDGLVPAQDWRHREREASADPGEPCPDPARRTKPRKASFWPCGGCSPVRRHPTRPGRVRRAPPWRCPQPPARPRSRPALRPHHVRLAGPPSARGQAVLAHPPQGQDCWCAKDGRGRRNSGHRAYAGAVSILLSRPAGLYRSDAHRAGRHRRQQLRPGREGGTPALAEPHRRRLDAGSRRAHECSEIIGPDIVANLGSPAREM